MIPGQIGEWVRGWCLVIEIKFSSCHIRCSNAIFVDGWYLNEGAKIIIDPDYGHVWFSA